MRQHKPTAPLVVAWQFLPDAPLQVCAEAGILLRSGGQVCEPGLGSSCPLKRICDRVENIAPLDPLER